MTHGRQGSKLECASKREVRGWVVHVLVELKISVAREGVRAFITLNALSLMNSVNMRFQRKFRKETFWAQWAFGMTTRLDICESIAGA